MGKIKLYRDPNVPTSTVRYNNAGMDYKFDPNDAVVEVEEEHAMFIVRDCLDLRRSKVKTKVERPKIEKTKVEGK